MHQRMTSQKGFTLAELLIAVVIMAVGIMGLAQLQVKAMQTSTHSSGMAGANALAQSIVEEIMSFPPDPDVITNEGGQPFLQTAINDSRLIYRDSRRPAASSLIDHSNVFIDGAGNYQVTYTTRPDYTNQAALGISSPIRVCRIEIVVTDRSESKFRNELRLVAFKNWTP